MTPEKIKEAEQATGSYTYKCNKAECYFCAKTKEYPKVLSDVFTLEDYKYILNKKQNGN